MSISCWNLTGLCKVRYGWGGRIVLVVQVTRTVHKPSGVYSDTSWRDATVDDLLDLGIPHGMWFEVDGRRAVT